MNELPEEVELFTKILLLMFSSESPLSSGEHVAFKPFYVALDEIHSREVVLPDEIVKPHRLHNLRAARFIPPGNE